MRDPELVARAQRAATRLESAWEQWRALHGLADAPGQPVVSYVEPLPEGTGEYPSPALLNAPSAVGRGRPSPDQARDIAAELVGWNQGELPSPLPEQFASWPPGVPTAADQPPASA
jgi:hypothetical protein